MKIEKKVLVSRESISRDPVGWSRSTYLCLVSTVDPNHVRRVPELEGIRGSYRGNAGELSIYLGDLVVECLVLLSAHRRRRAVRRVNLNGLSATLVSVVAIKTVVIFCSFDSRERTVVFSDPGYPGGFAGNQKHVYSMTSSLPNRAWCIARRPSDASCCAGKGKKKPLPNRSWSMQGIARPSDVISCRAGKGKKKPQYGSGRDALGSSSPVESLHFGRLIGESAKDTAQKLDQQSQKSPKEDDARAKLYLEKWTQEEDASYEMFESLLQGKPLDERAKKIKDIEFAEIMRMSADDEMLDDFEAVALSSSDEGVEGAVEAACLSKQSKVRTGRYSIKFRIVSYHGVAAEAGDCLLLVAGEEVGEVSTALGASGDDDGELGQLDQLHVDEFHARQGHVADERRDGGRRPVVREADEGADPVVRADKGPVDVWVDGFRHAVCFGR